MTKICAIVHFPFTQIQYSSYFLVLEISIERFELNLLKKLFYVRERFVSYSKKEEKIKIKPPYLTLSIEISPINKKKT